MTGTWTSSEDEDFGSLGDNKVIVIAGTSGTPVQFDDFVTADRAGEAVLLAATAGLSPTLALTYALRPVDVIALLISFIVASKTTETDHIFITGTDWRGAAQTENIDVSAGNGTYVSTKYFATISNIDCSDNSSGGGTQWADGTVRVTQPQWGFIWDHSDGDADRKQFRISATTWDIGDGSTTTWFIETDCQVVFDSECTPITTVGSTTNFGVKIKATVAKQGCHILSIDDANISATRTLNGTLNLYDTIWAQVGGSTRTSMHKYSLAGTHELIQGTINHGNKTSFSENLTVNGLTLLNSGNGYNFAGAGALANTTFYSDARLIQTNNVTVIASLTKVIYPALLKVNLCGENVVVSTEPPFST